MSSSSTSPRLTREEIVADVRGACPMFRETDDDTESVKFAGPLAVDDDKGELGYFTIELSVPFEYPARPLSVRETGGRIPRIADRHVYENGNCCIELPIDFYRRRPSRSAAEYITGRVRSYFLAQLHFEAHGTWPAGERRHNLDGVRDACLEYFGTDNLALVHMLVDPATRWRLFKQKPCPCGSGRRLFKCHGGRIRNTLRTWPSAAVDELRSHLDRALQPKAA